MIRLVGAHEMGMRWLYRPAMIIADAPRAERERGALLGKQGPVTIPIVCRFEKGS